MRTLAVACAVLAAAACATSEASAATIGVNTTKDEIAGGDHLCSLREAVDTVNAAPGNGDCAPPGATTTIVLKARTYVLTRHPAGADGNATGDLNLMTPVRTTLAGAGPAKTRIDATGLGDRVLSVSSGTHATLSRLTVTGGRAPDGPPGTDGTISVRPTAGKDGSSGGGIANAGSLTLRFVRVARNHAGDGGTGGSVNGSPDASAPGGAGGSGGGIANTGTLVVEDTAVTGNLAGHGGAGGQTPEGSGGGAGGAGGDGGSGGGVVNGGGAMTLRRSVISHNFAGSGGAGADGGYLRDTRGQNGGAGGDGGSGGGVVFGDLEATNSTIAGNFAGSGGAGGNGTNSGSINGDPGGNGGNGGDAGAAGGYGTIFAPAHLEDVTVSDNAVGSAGGGGDPGLGDSGAPSGTAGSAGASATGGGIGGTFAAITLTNSIVASNAGGACVGGAIKDGGHNLVFPADPGCPFGLHANPLLKSLGDYGGPTQTMALKPGSPAINKVPPGASCPGTDQRGVRRPHGRACEIGAFEFALPVITISRPRDGATYNKGAKVYAKFTCREAGATGLISSCVGTAPSGKLINTSTRGHKAFKVTAVDKAGNRVTKTVHYTVQ